MKYVKSDYYDYEDEFEDEEEYIRARYSYRKSKDLWDRDGFRTEYIWYYDEFDDKHVFVFDEDDLLFDDFDWECDGEEEAEGWFDSYGTMEDDIYRVDGWDDILSSTEICASYDTKLIAKYIKEYLSNQASGRGNYSMNFSDAERYMNRNQLIYNSRDNIVYLHDLKTREDTPLFKVIPQYSNTKKNGYCAPKTPVLEPID